MPSPFPGMNPYLEQNDVWEDFHRRFLVFLAGDLETHVGPNYLVTIKGRPALPDRVDVESEPFLVIRNRRDRRLITVIELLSRTNKMRGLDRAEYLRQRREVLCRSANFVEIDLLRGGLRPVPPDFPAADYCVFVSPETKRPNAYCWPWRLRDRLPVIPVPVAGPDADVLVDLQAILHRTYDEAGYGKYVYDEQPQPPLSVEDEAWARAILGGQASAPGAPN